jgi:predicted nuclease of predicted toxin-antitoxin system
VADRIKFYMDEHVAKAVTEGLRRRGVDVVSVQELGLHAAEDQQHLQRAAQEGRVVVTQDTDFLRLHAAGVSHRGIVYASQQTPVPQILRGLMLIHDVLTSEDMIRHVEFL